ncbi:3-methyl-2-oxobutanoate hydroxymethyltransferase [Curvivirga sp.]|uniref:3-methyl-2-oxobutanoate hydroxymethyltransferase n=1 Tax=Curvivirga sp. TaxID=2856848 RepID=UPI003B58FC3A
MSHELFGYVADQNKDRNEVPRLKINLYRDYEVAAVAKASAYLQEEGFPCRVECVMISDSYLMTHMGKSETSLETEDAQAEFFDLMKGLTEEVADATNKHFPSTSRPFVLADMPDGSTATPDKAIYHALQMMDVGADAVKLEIFSEDRFEIVRALSEVGVPVVSHLGYTPQSGQNRAFGNSLEEAQKLFAHARRARDVGSIGLVLERVNELVNQCLCRPSTDSIPVYSIFSGKADWGGQSLNVWDSIFKPDFKGSFFPSTATRERADYPDCYTEEALTASMYELMRQAIVGEYPNSPMSKLQQQDLRKIICSDPWHKPVEYIRAA